MNKPRRRAAARIHKWARQCRPFLASLLRRLGRRSGPAPPGSSHRLAAPLRRRPGHRARRGRATNVTPPHCDRFWDELAAWEQLERRLHGEDRPIDRGPLPPAARVRWRSEAGLARTPRGPGRVRFLSAEIARGVPADHVFVLGLGERSFPRLTAAEPIFDEQERQSLQSGRPRPARRQRPDARRDAAVLQRRHAGAASAGPQLSRRGREGAGTLAQLVSGGAARLLRAGRGPGDPPTHVDRGIDRDEPLSPAEHRVRAARASASGRRLPAGTGRATWPPTCAPRRWRPSAASTTPNTIPTMACCGIPPSSPSWAIASAARRSSARRRWKPTSPVRFASFWKTCCTWSRWRSPARRSRAATADSSSTAPWPGCTAI